MQPRTGVSSSGKEWKSQDFVIETDGGDKLCFNVFGDKAIQESGLRLSADVTLALDVVSKPTKDGARYFTGISLKQSYVSPAKASYSKPEPEQRQERRQEEAQPQPKASVGTDDLPF